MLALDRTRVEAGLLADNTRTASSKKAGQIVYHLCCLYVRNQKSGTGLSYEQIYIEIFYGMFGTMLESKCTRLRIPKYILGDEEITVPLSQ